MAFPKGLLLYTAIALVLLVFEILAASESTTDDLAPTTHAITANEDGDGSSLPDFDGDGTVGFGDFVRRKNPRLFGIYLQLPRREEYQRTAVGRRDAARGRYQSRQAHLDMAG